MNLDIDKLDFEHCEEEPIHVPESIQSYGYLFALQQEEGTIEIVSENTRELLKDQVLGKNFFELLSDEEDTEFLIETYHRARKKNTRLPLHLTFNPKVITNESANEYYAVVYSSGAYIVVELESAAQFRETYSAMQYAKLYAMSIAPKFKMFQSIEGMAQEIVETIRYITGMERVMLYKFNEDASGQVIAEAKVEDMESCLHFFYPASDIPEQAQALYKKNWVRLTPNIELEPSKLIPGVEKDGREPLDMTYSILRSLSPIHNQYIYNQGMKASMSMSLVTYDNLWGIISCHSRKPRYIPQNVRLECENLSQLFSWHLYAKEEELYLKKREEVDRSITFILDQTSPNNPIVKVFEKYRERVLKLMDADGFIFYTGEESIALGTTPALSSVLEIAQQDPTQQEKPYASVDISSKISINENPDNIRGMLLISPLENKKYFTAWFRKEHVEIQKWAGVPEEKAANASKRERLMPRASFEVHKKKISGKSKEWSEQDREVATRFNRVFMAYALETQEQMRQNITTLELHDKYKNEFLATLAHELRNPLTTINAGVSLLGKFTKEGTEGKVLTMVERQVGHMIAMIDDLMDVSRVTQGKVKLDRENTLLREVLGDALEVCAKLIREKEHRLETKYPEEEVWIYGDSTRLSQIFVNILNNAAKYTDPGGEIHVSVEKQADTASIKIKDNGLGIAPEELDVIFTMFTQMDSHAKNAKGGLGIGLTLVQKLAELHGGKIYARSEGVGKGSEFEVVLPLGRPKQESRTENDNEINMNGTKNQKILLVDDDEDIKSMIEILLRSEGYSVRTATSGKEAIEVFKEYLPHAAILDIGLPDMNGYQLCKKLAALPGAKKTIFLAQSGYNNQDEEKDDPEVCFKEYFVKPTNIQTLKEALRKYIHP